ncbi:hypothetical protein pb186bvf_005153 [Paramecium bursaria]
MSSPKFQYLKYYFLMYFVYLAIQRQSISGLHILMNNYLFGFYYRFLCSDFVEKQLLSFYLIVILEDSRLSLNYIPIQL